MQSCFTCNRRGFFGLTTLGLATTLSGRHAAATDVDIIENRMVEMFRMLPLLPGPDDLDFPETSGMDHRIQREVWPENPDTYWDPIGEDYHTVFGFYSNAWVVSAGQADVDIWSMDMAAYDFKLAMETLISNGWDVVEETPLLLHFAGSEADRTALGDALNMLGSFIYEGKWDWIGLPDAITIVTGSSEEMVRTVNDRVANYTPMTTMDTAIHGLRYVLPVNAYSAQLLPPQLLPVPNSSGGFICKAWNGDVPIVQSVGLRLATPEEVEPMLLTIRSRMEAEVSSITGTTYSAFLEITDSQAYYSTLRIDFISTDDSWDIFDARLAGDLGMLPPA